MDQVIEIERVDLAGVVALEALPHIVEEKLGGEEVLTLHVHFVEPSEIFDARAVEAALHNGDVSAFVCAYIGLNGEPPRDDQGRPLGGRLAHICRDTDEGMVLRSRFWLGAGLPASPEELSQIVPDEVGLGLMQHATREFKYLARFLPSLYIAENRESERPSLPW